MISDLHGGWPREREFTSPPDDTNSRVRRAPFHVSSMNDVKELKKRESIKEGMERRRVEREERRREKEAREEK